MNNPLLDISNDVLTAIINSIESGEHREKPALAWNHMRTFTQVLEKYPEVDLFSITDCDDGAKQVTPTLLAKAVISLLTNCMDTIEQYYPACICDPYVDQFIFNVEATKGILNDLKCHQALTIQNGIYRNDEDYNCFVDMANSVDRFIYYLRESMREDEFKTVCDNAKRASIKNRLSLLCYIGALFKRSARLLVLRIDLGYRKGDVIETFEDMQRSYEQAKRDRIRFLNKMDANNLFQHLVGYAWKLEYGPDTGFHYHFLLFFDGSQVREDSTLAMLIGEYWKNDITQGRGHYYNCNSKALKGGYKTVGIGMINHHDLHLRENLKAVAAYLTKIDWVAREVAGSDRTFGRGLTPETKANPMGRPRAA